MFEIIRIMPGKFADSEPFRKTVTFSDSINLQFISKNRRGIRLRGRINNSQKENCFPLLNNITGVTFSTTYISSQNLKSILKKPRYVADENTCGNVTDLNDVNKSKKEFAHSHEINQTSEAVTNFTSNENMSTKQKPISSLSSKGRKKPVKLMKISTTMPEQIESAHSSATDATSQKDESSEKEKSKSKISRKKTTKKAMQTSDNLITRESLRSSDFTKPLTRSSKQLKKPVEVSKTKSVSRVCRSTKSKSKKSSSFPKIVLKTKKQPSKRITENNSESESVPSSSNFPQFDFYFNKRFYDFLTERMESKFGSRTNTEVLELAKCINEVVTDTIKMDLGFQDRVKTLKILLFRKNIIVTNYDFYEFCMHYMPPRFSLKSIPMAPPFPNAEFDPKTAWCPVE